MSCKLTKFVDDRKFSKIVSHAELQKCFKNWEVRRQIKLRADTLMFQVGKKKT